MDLCLNQIRNFDTTRAVDVRFLSKVLFKVGQIDSIEFYVEYRSKSDLTKHLAMDLLTSYPFIV